MFQGAVSIFISSFSFRIPSPYSNISTHLLSQQLDLLSSEVLDRPPRPLWAPPSRLKCYDDDDDDFKNSYIRYYIHYNPTNVFFFHSSNSILTQARACGHRTALPNRRVGEFSSPSLRDSPFASNRLNQSYLLKILPSRTGPIQPFQLLASAACSLSRSYTSACKDIK